MIILADEGDMAMTEGEEVAYGSSGGAAVVHRDAGQLVISIAHTDHMHSGRVDIDEFVTVQAKIHEKQPINTLAQHAPLAHEATPLIAAAHAEQQEVISVGVQRVARTGHHLTEIPPTEFRHRHAHRMGTAGGQSRGVGIGSVR